MALGSLLMIGGAVAKLLLRANDLADGADAIGDAQEGWAALRRLTGRRQEHEQLAERIAGQLEQRLARAEDLDQRQDLQATARDVAGLIERLANDNAALLIATTHPDQLHRYALYKHEGAQLRADTAEAAEPFFDQLLDVTLDEYAALAPSSPRYQPTALTRILSTLEGVAEVSALASRSEVMSYLQARIADWDVSPWRAHQQRPSMLERSLRVRVSGDPTRSDDRELSAEEALSGQQMLAVLGGPGSGKTWLAHRYAREVAQTALHRLRESANLNDVELPLFTTWDRWTNELGGPQKSLVDSAFKSGTGHRETYGSSAGERLRRTFLHTGQKVLLVVDSLDEAADRAGQHHRLRELTALPGWRVVITSRPAAWDATHRPEPDPSRNPTVVELRDLS